MVFRFAYIISHWRMLCPNTQAVTNGYLAGWAPRSFFPKTCPNLDLGMGKMYMKRGGPTSFFFPRSPQYRYVDGKKYVKKGKQRLSMSISSQDVPKFGFGYGKM